MLQCAGGNVSLRERQISHSDYLDSNTMPSVNKGSIVLVTGANGYIAMWVVRTLLERGFTVLGTVRNEYKGKFVIEYCRSLGYGDKVEVVVVDDIVKVGNWRLSTIPDSDLEFKEGAFDEVVKGVDAIVHTASPFHFNPAEPEGVQIFHYDK